MLTFQIQDGGESFFRPLEGRSLTIGRSPGCDIRLQAPGVLDRHARVTAVDGPQGCRIRADSEGATMKVNGKPVREARLALGDRLELGQAVLVLGQQLRRPATASDVLEQTSSRHPQGRDRSGAAWSSSRLVIVATVVAALGLALFLSQWSPGAALEVPYSEKDQVRRARKEGRFDEGRKVLEELREGWAAQDPAKRELVDELGRQLEATAREFHRLRQEVREGVLDKSWVEQLAWIKALQAAKYPEAVREAAHIIAGRLTEYRRQDRAAALAGLEPRNPADAAEEAAPGAAARKPSREPSRRPGWLDDRIAEVRRLHEDKQHGRAMETLRQILPDVPVKHAGPLRDLLDEVRQATRDEMEQLVAQARELRREGRLSEAVRLLEAAVVRFPTIGPLAGVYHTLCGLKADLELGSVNRPVVAKTREAPRQPPGQAPREVPREDPRPEDPRPERPNALEPTAPETRDPAVPRIRRPAPAPAVAETDYSELFRAMLLRVGDAEQAGDLEAAVARAKYGISRLKPRPRLAAVLAGRIQDLALVMEMSRQVQARIQAALGLELEVSGVSGDSEAKVLAVSGMDGHLLVLGKEPEDTVKVGWFRLDPDEVERLLTATEVSAGGLLGLAVLRYRAGDSEGAEQLLARLVRQDTTFKARVDGIVSRGRNEHVDAGGYSLVNGRFVATRFLRVEELARKIRRRIAQLQGRDNKARDKVLAGFLEEGEEAADAVALALRTQQRKLIRNIDRSPFKKGHAKVAAVRERLDKARAHALELIFDHERYFYPYRPPAVSGEKASEYWKVQKEVDKRVAAVEKIWLHDRTRAVVPKALGRNLEFLRWVNASLTGLGEPVGAEMQQIAWTRTLPPVKALTASNFCKTVKEKERFLLETRIEMMNEALGEEVLSEAELSQVAITNTYRRMMGRNILAVNPKIHRAARGHAEEMAALGYFGHFSPKPERRTPYQRMKLEGYTFGVSENCARTASAADAHRRWLHSSGHHRNILMPGHTEFGVGNAGRLWVQNFGMGDDYRSSEHLPPPREQ